MKKNMLDYVVAVIPARGGSKRLPKKNIHPIWGKPMLSWSILAAKKSKYIHDIFVSSDDDNILKIAQEYNAKVIKRPKRLSDDITYKMEAIKHAVTEIEKEMSEAIEYAERSQFPVKEDLLKNVY